MTAVSHVDINSSGKSVIDFRILSLDLGYPTITVVDDLTTSAWKAGKYKKGETQDRKKYASQNLIRRIFI